MNTTKKVARIPVGDGHISVTLTVPRVRGPHPGIIFIHGWRGKQETYLKRAELLAQQGIASLTLTLRGHGEESGRISEVSRADNLKDVVAAYDYLVRDGRIDDSKIGIFGSSYGCYLAMLLSEKRGVAWMVLRAPALYRDAGFRKSTAVAIKNLWGYRQQVVSAGRNCALRALSKFTGQVLILAGEADSDVPQRTITNVLAACQSAERVECRILRRADHTLSNPTWHKEMVDITDRWIVERSIPI